MDPIILEGRVEQMFAERREDGTGCICCPDGRHCFGADIKIDAHPSIFRPWTNFNVSDPREWLSMVAFKTGFDKKRVKITIEVLD